MKNKLTKNLILVCLLYFVFYLIIHPLLSQYFTLLFNPQATSHNVWITFVLDFIVMLVLIFLIFDEYRSGFLTLVKEYKKAIVVLFLGIACLYTVNMISSLITMIFVGPQSSSNQSLIVENVAIAPLYMLFSVSIFAPLVEEGVFRGTIQKFLSQKFPKWISILIASFLFGFLHIVAGLLQGNLLELFYIIPYLALGIVLGIFYERYTISHTILIHSIYNLLSFVMILTL